jgi:hypothetical protein
MQGENKRFFINGEVRYGKSTYFGFIGNRIDKFSIQKHLRLPPRPPAGMMLAEKCVAAAPVKVL